MAAPAKEPTTTWGAFALTRRSNALRHTRVWAGPPQLVLVRASVRVCALAPASSPSLRRAIAEAAFNHSLAPLPCPALPCQCHDGAEVLMYVCGPRGALAEIYSWEEVATKTLLRTLGLATGRPLPTKRIAEVLRWETARVDAAAVRDVVVLRDAAAQCPYVRYKYAVGGSGAGVLETRHCTLEAAFGAFSGPLCAALRACNPAVWDALPRIQLEDVVEGEAGEREEDWEEGLRLTDAAFQRLFPGRAAQEQASHAVV